MSSAVVHGGPDALGTTLHDFSTNANACGPCPIALAAVHSADATRYPDPAYTTLAERLAAFHGVDPQRIVIAASASEFIRRITAWAMASSASGYVQVPVLAYGDYAAAAGALGLRVQHAPDVSQAPVLAWACDPSAPLGQTAQHLVERIDSLPEATPCVLDRAYEPLRLHGGCALDGDRIERVWQLWSPNKALGLTGIRGAYAIAPSSSSATATVEWLRRASPSWPVGAHGVAMLAAWTEEPTQTWVGHSLHTLREWKAQQIDLCVALGWKCMPSRANYFCAQPASTDLVLDLARLRTAGIKLRDCASFGLSGTVRLGVLPPASQHALAEAWRRR